MAVPTSGAVSFSTVSTEFGIGGSMYALYGRSYYYLGAGASLQSGVFPSSGSFSASLCYGKSPDNDWACACADCNCK